MDIHPAATAAVIDLDNLLHRGVDRLTGRSRPQALLDIHGFCSALWGRGVVRGTVCRNRQFSPEEKRQWSRFGFATVTTGRNCDPDVIKIARCFAQQGVKEIVLVSGDHGYSSMVKEFGTRNIFVEVWSRTEKLSQELARCASSVRVCSARSAPASRKSLNGASGRTSRAGAVSAWAN